MKSHSNRPLSIQKERRKFFIWIPVLLLLLAGALLAFMYFSGFFYNRKNIEKKEIVRAEEINLLSNSSEIVPSDMLNRTLSLLKDQMNTSPYVVSWYVLPGNISSLPGLSSDYLVAVDQVNLLRYYIKTGDRNSASDLARAIEADFAGKEGFLVPARKVSEIASLEAPQPAFQGNAAYEELPVMSSYSLEATASYLRALLEYYQKWGKESDWNRIEKFAGIIYKDDTGFPEDLTVSAAPSPVPTGPDLDIVSVIEGQISAGGTFTALTIASLDLDVFRMLSSFDSKYQPLYDSALEILSGAMISDELPLYAIGYTQNLDGYVYFFKEPAQADLVSSLKVTLHLAEAGKAPLKTLLWIKEQLFNEGFLYVSYDLMSGQTTTEAEAVEAYGILLQIARAADDAELYRVVSKRLEEHLATSAASAARGMVFRQLGNARVAVYAKDNLEVLLGVEKHGFMPKATGKINFFLKKENQLVKTPFFHCLANVFSL